MDRFDGALRIAIILLAPATFFVTLWSEKQRNIPPGGVAKIGALFLVLGVLGGYIGTRLSPTTQWRGLIPFVTFESDTIHYFSDFIAIGYGFVAYALLRTLSPRRGR